MELPIKEERIFDALSEGRKLSFEEAVLAIEKAKDAQKLKLAEIAAICFHAADLEEKLFEVASFVRRSIYGRRMILFAPLYWSNFCVNNCFYCGFRHENSELERIILKEEEVLDQARFLVSRGYRRILLESGEDPIHNDIDYLCRIMRLLYGLKDDFGRPAIDRINVNIAAAALGDYKKLIEAGIGTYNLFQETYHQPTYERMHPKGPKHDYTRQITAHDRAIEAGIGDVGLGVLWGLYDWHFELLALVEHSKYLELKFGFGPHAISTPRVKPATNVCFNPPFPVSDDDFLRIVAILRISVPYSGLIISTRESANLRQKAFSIGISQTSAGSSTEVGGYSKDKRSGHGQFSIEDGRCLEDVIRELIQDGFIPAFCTACEQRGRTGLSFMKMAQTGLIGSLCTVNSIIAFKQYLIDGARVGFIGKETENLGNDLIGRELKNLSPFVMAELHKALDCIERNALAKDFYI